jgi:hypothetical protein
MGKLIMLLGLLSLWLDNGQLICWHGGVYSSAGYRG